MSSGPMGLDVKEYAFGVFRYTVADGLTHNFSTQNRWLVTRIQAFAPPGNAVALTVAGSSTIFIEAGGCVILEPNGAHRGVISFSGLGGIAIVEYWFQATPTGNTPIVAVSPP